MSKLLKIAGVTSGKLASGIKVDELGRIELSRTVEPKRIIGNVLEPYSEDYKGPVSVFGLELYAINSEHKIDKTLSSYSQPTPDGWLMRARGELVRYDSKGSVIWVGERRVGDDSRFGEPAVHGGHVYTVTSLGAPGISPFVVDKLSDKTGKIVMRGGTIVGHGGAAVSLSYAPDIDRLVGYIRSTDSQEVIYVHPETLDIEYSGDISEHMISVFGSEDLSNANIRYERGVIYLISNTKGVASAKVVASVAETAQSLTKLFGIPSNVGSGFVLNGDVYSEGFGANVAKPIMRNGVVIHTRETPKTVSSFVGGSAGNLALMADGNKVLAFDKDNLVMSVEIPHDIEIKNIAGDSMGNIFVGTTGGIYILGDTLQIKGYQLVG